MLGNTDLFFTVAWAVVAVICAIIEVTTVQLTTVWFGIGAIAALIAHIFGLNQYIQLVIFLAVSILSFIFVKPLMKNVNKLSQEDINSMIGQKCTVKSVEHTYDGILCTVEYKGTKWKATVIDGYVVYEGRTATIEKVVGNELLVKGISIDKLTGVDEN